MSNEPAAVVRGPMPKVTLYVKDSDGPIWDRARSLVTKGDDDSLSAFVTEALALHVERRERELRADKDLAGSMESYTIRVEPEDAPPRTLRFTGAHVHESVEMYGGTQDVYVTKARQIVVTTSMHGSVIDADMFPNLDALQEVDKLGHSDEARLELLREVAAALGREFIEDID